MTVIGSAVRAARLEPGAMVQFDGRIWTVVGLYGPAVHLRDGLDLSVWLVSEVVGADDFKVVAHADGSEPPTVGSQALGFESLFDTLPESERAKVDLRFDAVTLLRESRLPGQPPDPNLVDLGVVERAEVVGARYGVSGRAVRQWAARLDQLGLAGLADRRHLAHGRPIGVIDPQWRVAIHNVLDYNTLRSKPTVERLIELVREEEAAWGAPEGAGAPPVSDRTLRRYIDRLGKPRGLHLSTSTQRSIANRPSGAWGRVTASRLGQLVAIDATPLDAFAMDAIEGRWQQVHLVLAIDLCTRSLLGWQFTPGEPKDVDAALLLHSIVTPRRVDEGWLEEGKWRYAGVPEAVIAGLLESDPLLPKDTGEDVLGVPSVVPDEVLLDHGKVFVSNTFRRACLTLGISLHLGRPYTPTDKSHVERVFGTIRTGFVQPLPGYKGPDIASRGTLETVEGEAFLFLHEIEERFAEWVAVVYQNTRHEGLRLPYLPSVTLTPNEAVDLSIARAGYVPVPVSRDLHIEMLRTEWRTIRPEGIEFNGLIYDVPRRSPLDEYRGMPSPYPGKGDRWRIKVDPRNLARIWFFKFDTPQDPKVGAGHWVPIPARGWDDRLPFSDRTVSYVKRLLHEQRIDRPSHEQVIKGLRTVIAARHASSDSMTTKEKLLAAHDNAQQQRNAAEGRPLGSTTTGTKPDDSTAPTDSAPPASGLTQRRSSKRSTPVASGPIKPMAADEVTEYDPLADDEPFGDDLADVD